MEVRIKLDKKELSKAFAELGKRGAKSAVTMAINKVLAGVRTDAKAHIKKDVGLATSGPLQRRMTIHKASRRTLSGDVTFSGAIPLKAYKGWKVKRGAGGGVFVKGKKIERSFRGNMGRLRNDLFMRVGKSRNLVKRLYGSHPMRIIFGCWQKRITCHCIAFVS